MIAVYFAATDRLKKLDWLVPTLARLVFAGVLFVYFINSGLTKWGDGFWGWMSPSTGAYAQIFPRALESVGYDVGSLSLLHHLIVIAAIVAEFTLPALIVLGLLTRLAALGMIVFVVVQSFTDIYGHSQTGAVGAWFDRFSDALILDQRALWILLLITLVIKGAGPVSFDAALRTSVHTKTKAQP